MNIIAIVFVFVNTTNKELTRMCVELYTLDSWMTTSSL